MIDAYWYNKNRAATVSSSLPGFIHQRTQHILSQHKRELVCLIFSMKAVQSNQISMCIWAHIWALLHYWALDIFPSITDWLGKGCQKSSQTPTPPRILLTHCISWYFPYPCHALATCIPLFFGLSHLLLLYSFCFHKHQSVWKDFCHSVISSCFSPSTFGFKTHIPEARFLFYSAFHRAKA